MHISESVKFSVLLCLSWTQYDCRVCIFLNSCTDIVSSAKFVMIVEKDATFQRLLDDDFCTKLSPCIIITVCFLFATLLFDGRMWLFESHSSECHLFIRKRQYDCCTTVCMTGVLVLIRVKACQM